MKLFLLIALLFVCQRAWAGTHIMTNDAAVLTQASISSNTILSGATFYNAAGAWIGQDTDSNAATFLGNALTLENKTAPFSNVFDLKFSESGSVKGMIRGHATGGNVNSTSNSQGLLFESSNAFPNFYIVGLDTPGATPYAGIPSTGTFALGSGGVGMRYVGFHSSAAVTTNTVWTLPNADAQGTWISDGAGNLQIDAPQAFSQTLAQLQALTPARVGLLYYCSNCATASVCVSTANTAAYSFSTVNTRTAQCN